jgi:two-component system alkaline phosphatase synthesis response regulator PhoP
MTDLSIEKKKVLIVDDERDIVETLKFVIESEGIECLTAYDGEEALNLAKSEMPDLMVLDVMLPKINGYKICRLLKFDSKYKDIPILMITARSQEEDKAIGEETGADEYITKPFDINEVVKKIKNYLAI